MIFSSQIFLFLFLPITFLGYYFLKRFSSNSLNGKSKNMWLLLVSIFFYAYGEPIFIYVLITLSIFNWIMSKLIERRNAFKKIFLVVAILVDSMALIICKYLGFIVDNFNTLFKTDILKPEIALPIGISFFTFQAISYIIDIYRGDAEVADTPLEVGLYLLFFPQLIAGPIIRYKSIASEINNRRESLEEVACGIERLIIGIGKKVLIANILGESADAIFSGKLETSILLYWIGALCYMFQIYYDFSGYSDMAIGLGRMFGFHFSENFNYPYISKSVTEFWRRWHISLSSWFRDYVYIPLGGSRSGKVRTLFNLFVVWLFTGVWHGANWTFIIWGVYYFVFLVVEKQFKLYERKIPKLISYPFTMLIVLIGWVIFRAASLKDAENYVLGMFGMNGQAAVNEIAILYLKENFIILIVAMLFSFPIVNKCKAICGKYNRHNQYMEIGKTVALSLVLIAAISYLVKGAYNPFIYFNF